MHTELEVLEKFFLPAISTNLLPSRTYFTWTILLKQDEDNIIGVPRRLAMVDRGHLPQSRMTVGQTEQVCILLSQTQKHSFTHFQTPCNKCV